jgi:hypothetical protein
VKRLIIAIPSPRGSDLTHFEVQCARLCVFFGGTQIGPGAGPWSSGCGSTSARSRRRTGRASYQISITKCDECRRAPVQASGELVEVGDKVLEMAECDAQRIGRIGLVEGESAGTGTGTGTDARVGAVTGTGTAAHVGPTHGGARANQRSDRAKDVPPAIRRLVFLRDHGQITSPMGSSCSAAPTITPRTALSCSYQGACRRECASSTRTGPSMADRQRRPLPKRVRRDFRYPAGCPKPSTSL